MTYSGQSTYTYHVCKLRHTLIEIHALMYLDWHVDRHIEYQFMYMVLYVDQLLCKTVFVYKWKLDKVWFQSNSPHHRTSRPRGQQSLTWGTVSSRYKYNSKLQATFRGTVETTGTGTETKTGFWIKKKHPMRKFFGTQWHLTAKPAVRSSWNLNSNEILCLF